MATVSSHLNRSLMTIAASAVMATASAVGASAESLRVTVMGRVAEQCAASLSAAQISADGRLEGTVLTQCNTRFRLTLRFAPHLGHAVGRYAGQTVDGDHGELVLSASAAPTIGSAPLSVSFSNHDAAVEARHALRGE